MNNTHVVAVILAVIAIAIGSLTLAPKAHQEGSLSLKQIKTEHVATFAAAQKPNCAWFVEAVAATPATAKSNCAWFVEAVDAPSLVSNTKQNCAWFVEAVTPVTDRQTESDYLRSALAKL
jgi:hypothetical protein